MINLNRRNLLAATATGVMAASVNPFGKVARAEPKRGGTLRIGINGGNTTDSLDGATHSDAFMQNLGMGCVFDCLTEVAADGSLQGELAESWEASDDAVQWTFTLRKGVAFHNGKDFGADDVIESIQHHMGDDSKSAAKPIVSPIQTIEKLDSHTVRFTLANGNADFPYLLSDYHLLIYPAGMLEEAMTTGIGTGAYVLESFEPGVRAFATKNPNDYRSDRGHFDAIEFIGIADPAARTNALITGEVDVINRVDLKTERMLARSGDIAIFEVTGNQHFTFPMHTDKTPFNDVNVRLALKYGINREEMVQKILRGHGIAGNDHPIGPANQYWASDLEQRSFDPDKAKFYLKEAGLSELNVDLSAAEAAFPGAVDAAQLFAESASASGINLNIVREPSDGYWSNVWLKKPFCACYWSGRPTEDWMFATAYERGVPWNDTNWDHEKFNNLLVEARAELDSDRRRDLYREMQEIVRDDGGVIVPMFANYVDAASNKLTNSGTIGNAWQLDGCRIAERWWFA